jgi:hypothetical protein
MDEFSPAAQFENADGPHAGERVAMSGLPNHDRNGPFIGGDCHN